MSNLATLVLQFRSPQSRPDQESRRLPPPKRTILPALDEFRFKGVTDYFEDLLTCIDTPQLYCMKITFFNQIDFDTPRLAQFINRTPKLGKREARVQFDDNFARIGLLPGFSTFEIAISCREPDWQLSSIEQICNSSLQPLSALKDLYIKHQYSQLVWNNDAIESTLWLQLFLPFIAVESLYLSEELASGIAAALQDLAGEGGTDVLPSLRNIFVEGLEPSGPFQKDIRQFLAARQLSNHPIAISVWRN